MKIKLTHDPNRMTIKVKAKIPNWFHRDPSYIKWGVVAATIREYVGEHDLYQELMTEEEVQHDDDLFFEAMDTHSDEDWNKYHAYRKKAKNQLTAALVKAFKKVFQEDTNHTLIFVHDFAVIFKF